MLECLNMYPWFVRLVTGLPAIELKCNLIVYLILNDLNLPGYQNCDVPPKANTCCSLPHQRLVQCGLLTLTSVETHSQTTTKEMPEYQLLCGRQDAPLIFTRSTLGCRG